MRALYKETCRFFACGIVRSILLDVTFFVTFFCNIENADIDVAYYVALSIIFFVTFKMLTLMLHIMLHCL